MAKDQISPVSGPVPPRAPCNCRHPGSLGGDCDGSCQFPEPVVDMLVRSLNEMLGDDAEWFQEHPDDHDKRAIDSLGRSIYRARWMKRDRARKVLDFVAAQTEYERKSDLAQCLDLKPVAWRYRFVTSIHGDLSDWFIVDDEKSIPSRNPNTQTVQPLYLASPDTSTVRALELLEERPAAALRALVIEECAKIAESSAVTSNGTRIGIGIATKVRALAASPISSPDRSTSIPCGRAGGSCQCTSIEECPRAFAQLNQE